jgi:hypothetical protein
MRIKFIVLIACMIICNIGFSQEQEDADGIFRAKFYIKKGQKLYTKDSKFINGLTPVSKKTIQKINEQTVETVETGDYEKEETTEGGVTTTKNGDYTIYKTITKGSGAQAETTFEIKKKEFVKQNKIKLEIDITQDDDVVYVELSRGIKKETGSVANLTNSATIINSADNDATFYWKLEPGEEFKYYRTAWSFGALSLPFKIRFGKESQGRPSTIETGLDNVGIYLGRRYSIIKYKNGSFKYFHFTIAPFAGPQKITVNKDNSKGIITEEIDRLGVTTGIAISFSAGNLTAGIAPGIDFLSGKYKEDWVYNKKLWLGFAVGYKISLF